MGYSEEFLLAIISEYFENTHETFLFGRGDDCALIQVPAAHDSRNTKSPENIKSQHSTQNLLAITTDIFAEKSHFRHRYFTASQVGHKSLAVNISDLASNGAKPTAFSLALSLTGKEEESWLRDFFSGMAKLAKAHNMALSGGDLTKTDSMNIVITAWGDYSHGGKPLLRQRSFDGEKLQIGDIIFVIGHIGLARTGLFGLEASQGSGKEFQTKYPCACAKHLEPEPLVKQGLALSMLAKKRRICLMDVSDGLARDLPRLIGAGLGADIHINRQNLHPEVLIWTEKQGISFIEHAYEGGEDYALLGACAPELWDQIQENLALCENTMGGASLDDMPTGMHANTLEKFLASSHIKTPIWKLGNITKKDIFLNEKKVTNCGFDHFAE